MRAVSANVRKAGLAKTVSQSNVIYDVLNTGSARMEPASVPSDGTANIVLWVNSLLLFFFFFFLQQILHSNSDTIRLHQSSSRFSTGCSYIISLN